MRNPFKKKDPFALERKDGLFRGVAVRERKRRFKFLGRKWVAIPLIIVLLLGIPGGYLAYRYYKAQGNVQDPDIEVVEVDEDVDPFNVLLVGSDSREGLTQAEQDRFGADDVNPDGTKITGERADTLILAHIDPETNRITMVQFPRDLYVPVAQGGKNKINSALEDGRPNMVETMKALTGLDINKYLQVNIAGFRDLVDAIGGVEVCIPEPIPFDPATGIEVKEDEVGMVEFDGERALRFVRSRKIFANGDFGRIQNQQKFLAAAISKLTSPTTLFKVGTLLDLLHVAEDTIRTDKHTTINGMRELSAKFKSFDPANYEAYTAPNIGIGENEAGSVVLPDNAGMEVLFQAIADNVSPAEADGVPPIDVTEVHVGVYNGTDEDGLASRSAAKLEKATTLAEGSVDIVEFADADKKNYTNTVIVYDPDEPRAQVKADLVAAAIPGATVEEGKTPTLIDVSVIVGSEPFRTEKLVQLTPLPLPQPGELPAVCRE